MCMYPTYKFISKTYEKFETINNYLQRPRVNRFVKVYIISIAVLIFALIYNIYYICMLVDVSSLTYCAKASGCERNNDSELKLTVTNKRENDKY